jgi:NADH:ubiquinone oxidoreductase subunit H
MSLALILLSFVFSICGCNLVDFYHFQYCLLIFFKFLLCFVWFISCLAETKHTAFQFAEGGSELVSSFNIEYGAGTFISSSFG